MPRDKASTLHDDSLRELVSSMNKYLTGARTLKKHELQHANSGANGGT